MRKLVFGLMALAVLSGELPAGGRRPGYVPQPVSPQQARREITEKAGKEGWSSQNRKKAIGVLGILEEEGIPVETALKAVIEAGDSRERQGQLTEPGRVAELREEGARSMISREVHRQSWDDCSRETALNVLDQLIEEGVEVETARIAVLNSIRRHGTPVQAERLLREERVEELKRKRADDMERVPPADVPARDPEGRPGRR